MYSKFILSLAMGLFLSTGLFASNEYKTISFELNLDTESSQAVFGLRQKLYNFIDSQNERHERLESRPEELPLQPLAKLYVNLSIHTASIIQPYLALLYIQAPPVSG